MKRLITLAPAIVLALSGCVGGGNPTPGVTDEGSPIIVGMADSTESEVVAELYAGALRAKGVDVITTIRMRSRDVYLEALKVGSITLIPEYTGALLASFAPNDPAQTPEEIEAALPDAVGPDLAVLKPSAASNHAVYVVTTKLSDAQDIRSLRDLSRISATSTLGGSLELENSPYGPKGLADVYNVSFKEFRVYEPTGTASVSVLASALIDNSIQVAAFCATNSALAGNDFVQLTDPEMMVLPQNVVPLAAASVVKNQKAVDAVNAVQAVLTTDQLLELNRQVDVERRGASEVAAEWLSSHGLA